MKCTKTYSDNNMGFSHPYLQVGICSSKPYKASGWAKLDTTSAIASGEYRVAEINQAGEITTAHWVVWNGNNNTWQFKELTFTTRPDTYRLWAFCELRLVASEGQPTSVWFDDLSLIRLDSDSMPIGGQSVANTVKALAGAAGQTATRSTVAPVNEVSMYYLAADFDGDDKADLGEAGRSQRSEISGQWWIWLSKSGYAPSMLAGMGEGIPVAADYDGDGGDVPSSVKI